MKTALSATVLHGSTAEGRFRHSGGLFYPQIIRPVFFVFGFFGEAVDIAIFQLLAAVVRNAIVACSFITQRHEREIFKFCRHGNRAIRDLLFLFHISIGERASVSIPHNPQHCGAIIPRTPLKTA